MLPDFNKNSLKMDFKLDTLNDSVMSSLAPGHDSDIVISELLSVENSDSIPTADATIQESEEMLHLDTPKTSKNVQVSPVRPNSTPKNNQAGLQTQGVTC